jgi:hypothetical protein
LFCAAQAFAAAYDDFSYPFEKLSFQDLEIHHPEIHLFTTKAAGSADFPEAILGISVLRRLHIYIARKEEKLYITPATAH